MSQFLDASCDLVYTVELTYEMIFSSNEATIDNEYPQRVQIYVYIDFV